MGDRTGLLTGIRTKISATAVACVITSVSSSIASAAPAAETTTPIQHLIVIFQENISFDHYFGTYPTALNSPGEPAFTARKGTPSVNGLGTLVDGEPEGV